MKRLNKKQVAELTELNTKLEDAALAFNTARSEFEEFREGILADMEAYTDERSERWSEGEAGEQYAGWIAAWGEEVIDEVDEALPEYPETPEDV